MKKTSIDGSRLNNSLLIITFWGIPWYPSKQDTFVHVHEYFGTILGNLLTEETKFKIVDNYIKSQ